ncbi:MAG TPA: MFS transporter, partial [Oscillatoriaceae cyanobacterium]
MSDPRTRWLAPVLASAVCALALLLLVYAGLGEAYRTYPTFVTRSLASQGEVVQEAIDRFAASGLPIAQYPGLAGGVATLMRTDAAIARVSVHDPQGRRLFVREQPGAPKAGDFHTSAIALPGVDATLQESPALFRVTLPLGNKFEPLGALCLDLPRTGVQRAVSRAFAAVWIALPLALGLFAALAVRLYRTRERHRAGQLVGGLYGAAYLAIAVVIALSLTGLYAGAIRAETTALGQSLAGRLNRAYAIGLRLEDFSGVADTFHGYQRRDPDLAYASLSAQNQVLVDTDDHRLGKAWHVPAACLDVDVPLAAPGRVLHVGVANRVFTDTLWRSIKNFGVIFVAMSFLAVLFFGFLNLLLEREPGAASFQLGAIRPLYFLAVFLEGLASSFLPPYFRDLAAQRHVGAAWVSGLFTLYFLAFWAVLLPAGRYAQARGSRPLVLVGTALAGLGMGLAALSGQFFWMLPARLLAGAGQGLLFVGVETYILQLAAQSRRTQGSAIIVYGYNGGMIAGGAIGALLAVYMGVRPVMGLAAAIAALVLIYAFVFLENTLPANHDAIPWKQVFAQLGRDSEFMRTITLVGVPTKAVLTGVTIFAAPLVLSHAGYAREDIGQILMFYAAGVLLCSRYASRWVDASGRTRPFLMLGILASAAGLGLVGMGPIAHLPAVAAPVVGLFVLGLGHGLINAPVVTHISRTRVAESLGQGLTSSTYRMLERVGHVSGPLLVAQLLFLCGGGTTGLVWLGGAVLALGVIFMLVRPA